MIYTLGIDIGSTTSKCAVLEDGKIIKATSLVKGGAGTRFPLMAFEKVLSEANITRENLSEIVATGYGRTTFSESANQLSELSCHAKGVHFISPETRTIIDIGGQDVKVISINEQGKMLNFLMNDKCAAGTGRFLDVMASILQLDIEELEKEAEKSTQSVSISNTCTVFAESEVISQLASGVEIQDLVAGICESVARRVGGLAKRIGIKDTVFMSGGVAQNGGVRKALENVLDTKVIFTENAQFMGAIGAALFAYDKVIKNSKEV